MSYTENAQNVQKYLYGVQYTSRVSIRYWQVNYTYTYAHVKFQKIVILDIGLGQPFVSFALRYKRDSKYSAWKWYQLSFFIHLFKDTYDLNGILLSIEIQWSYLD